MIGNKSYTFDDILIQPRKSTINSRKEINLSVNLGTNGRSLILNKPLISSPMDTITEENMAIHMALNGGIGIIHRYMSFIDQIKQITNVKRYIRYIITEPLYCYDTDSLDTLLKQSSTYNIYTFCVKNSADVFVGLITKRDFNREIEGIPEKSTIAADIMTDINYIKAIYIEELPPLIYGNIYLEGIMNSAKKIMTQYGIEKIPLINSGGHLLGLITLKCVNHYFNSSKCIYTLDALGRLCVGAAVGITGNYIEQVGQLIDAGCDLICVDVANGHNMNVIHVCDNIRNAYPNIVLMAGNICDAAMVGEYIRVGVDCIRIGIGNGSICSTRLETGIGNCQFSAIFETFKYLASAGMDKRINLICDGGTLGKTGNKAKALCAGATAIMLGNTLSGTIESAGKIIVRQGKKYKYFRGMASMTANISKKERCGAVEDIGSISNVEGVEGMTEIKGNVADILVGICNGLRSCLSYLNVLSIGELHDCNVGGNIVFREISQSGIYESGIRIKSC